MPQAAATDLVLWGTYCVRPGGPGIDGMEGGSKRAFPRGKLTPRAWLPHTLPRGHIYAAAEKDLGPSPLLSPGLAGPGA